MKISKCVLNQFGKVHKGANTPKQSVWETSSLQKTQKTENMKINIEFDPRVSQERRKQCALACQKDLHGIPVSLNKVSLKSVGYRLRISRFKFITLSGLSFVLASPLLSDPFVSGVGVGGFHCRSHQKTLNCD